MFILLFCVKNNSNIIHFFRFIYIFARYPKYFIAILLFSSPSMFSCFVSTHIYLDTYEYAFSCDCLSPSAFAYFCGRNTPQGSRTIVPSCLFLDSFLISSISSPFFPFFPSFHFYVLPYCYFTFLPSPFRFCAFLSSLFCLLAILLPSHLFHRSFLKTTNYVLRSYFYCFYYTTHR